MPHVWNLSAIFKDMETLQERKAEFLPRAKKAAEYAGRLAASSTVLREALDLVWSSELALRQLESYTSNSANQDTRDLRRKALGNEVESLRSQFAEITSFIEPEITAMPEALLEGFLKAEPGLAVYDRYISEILRRKKHILSTPEEKILAATSNISGAGHSAYTLLSNADLPRKSVTLKSGEEVRLTDSNFVKHRRAPDKSDRDLLSETFFRQYNDFQRTIGEMLYSQMKSHQFYASMRGYPDTLSAALDRDDIDTGIYKNLIEVAHKNLPVFHRYLRLKARALGVERADYQDLYVPFTRTDQIETDYEQSKDLLAESLAPLGGDYVGLLRRAFDEGWIDVPPTEGKRSGAYSSGWAYGVHPFVLLNFNGQYADALTFAHEMGHAMHSHYSNATQPLPMSDYSIFVAEVASTFNENLLNDYMLDRVKSDEERVYLLGNFLDGNIKGTFFRQVQFAEFEWLIHQRVERGESLTGDVLGEIYLELLRTYYGHKEGACNVPDYFAAEWAYIPHFYYNYYVFQYSTSFAASSSLARQVLDKVPGALDRYHGMLRAGNTKDPVSILRDAGVDMTHPCAYDALMERAGRYMDELEKILGAGSR